MAAVGMSKWEPTTPRLGSTNAVLVARSRRHVVKDFPGPLSIKTVTEGRVSWRVDRRDIWVEDDLRLNRLFPRTLHDDKQVVRLVQQKELQPLQ